MSKPIIGIAGFGLEGQATYAYFKGKAEIHIFDEKEISPDGLDAVIHHGLSIPAEITTVYKTPGIPTHKIKLASTETFITTLTELLMEGVHGQVIGVTGTKGKSTVASLIHHILSSAGKESRLLGNIGSLDMSIIDTPDLGCWYVFELSSYQCEYLKHSPHIAVLTNLYQEHLTHHGSFDKYREAKLNIARFQSEKDVFINGSDLQVSFGGQVVVPGTYERFETQLLGEHNQHNCALALRAVEAVGISEAEAREYIKTFAPLEYRLEKVGEFKGVTFYDDSLATIPEATMASIQALPHVDTLILGGEDRGISFDAFSEYLATSDIKTFIIFPDTGAKMVTSVQGRTILPVTTMEEAVRMAYEHTSPGGTVLLSNASPSFNLFKDYKDKSAQYRTWIRSMGVE